jgi:hypothetical protein
LLTRIHVGNLPPHIRFERHRVTLRTDEDLDPINHVKGVWEIDFRLHRIFQAIVARVADDSDDRCPLVASSSGQHAWRMIYQVRNTDRMTYYILVGEIAPNKCLVHQRQACAPRGFGFIPKPALKERDTKQRKKLGINKIDVDAF